MFLAPLGLYYCPQAFSRCGKKGLLSGSDAQASLCDGFSCCGAQASLPWRHVGSPRVKDQTCVPCIGRWLLNHGATMEVLLLSFKSMSSWQLWPLYYLCLVRALSLHLCSTLATPWTVARQAPLSMGFSRQEDWSGLPCPSPGESLWPRGRNCVAWILYPLSHLGSPFLFILFICAFLFILILETEMAIYSNILAWKIPWIEGPGGLQSTGLQRVGYNWAPSLSLHFLFSLNLTLLVFGKEKHFFFFLFSIWNHGGCRKGEKDSRCITSL